MNWSEKKTGSRWVQSLSREEQFSEPLRQLVAQAKQFRMATLEKAEEAKPFRDQSGG